MSTKVVLVILLAFFVALSASESPPSIVPTLTDVTSDTSARTLHAIELAKNHLVTELNACQANMHVDRIVQQENPGRLYTLTVRVEPCAGSPSSTKTCTVEVLDMPSSRPAEVHRFECSPAA